MNIISRSSRTIGARQMPDDLDSGGCHVCINAAALRINIDGIWTSLCDEHVRVLRQALDNPLPSPMVAADAR